MTKEEVKEFYKKLKEAQEDYQNYVEQFLTSVRDGVVVSEATKALNREELDKIKELRNREEQLKQKYDQARDTWFASLRH